MKKLFVFFLFIAFVSCKSTELTGVYALKDIPETKLELKKDGTYEFTRKNDNPYLHPSYRPEHNFFTTSGHWQQSDKKLILNDRIETTASNQPELLENSENNSLRYTTIKFYDFSGDTANILYAKFPDGTQLASMHKPIATLPWPADLSDTIEFFVYGYKPFTYIRSDKKKRQLKFRLYPEVRNDFFKEKEFIISRRKLIDGEFIFRIVKAK